MHRGQIQSNALRSTFIKAALSLHGFLTLHYTFFPYNILFLIRYQLIPQFKSQSRAKQIPLPFRIHHHRFYVRKLAHVLQAQEILFHNQKLLKLKRINLWVADLSLNSLWVYFTSLLRSVRQPLKVIVLNQSHRLKSPFWHLIWFQCSEAELNSISRHKFNDIIHYSHISILHRSSYRWRHFKKHLIIRSNVSLKVWNFEFRTSLGPNSSMMKVSPSPGKRSHEVSESVWQSPSIVKLLAILSPSTSLVAMPCGHPNPNSYVP